MSFVTTHPEALAYAAGKLQTLGSVLAAESAAAAPQTTGVIPAAADEISALQAAIFRAYGSLYQSVNAQATTIHDLFVQTLGASAGSYAATESANSGATASRLSAVMSSLLSPAASADPPGGNVANLINIGSGTGPPLAQTCSTWHGRHSPAANEAGDTFGEPAERRPDWMELEGAGAPACSAGLGGVPMLGGLGQASAVGRMAVPPSWVAEGAPAASPAAVTTAGWTAPAPQSIPVTSVPAGMPVVGTAGKTAGLGTPRYGVKPTVMARPTAG